MRQPELVKTQSIFEEHCDVWRASGLFTFDTEFIRDETYDAALCLIQVAAGKEVVLLDPTAGLDLTPFWNLVSDPAVVKVVHSGKEDFEVCLRTTGRLPRNVYDVQIAAGFVGHGYPLSLSRLVEAVLGRRISKSQTLTDWLRRPLTAAQLKYAVEDVAYLPEIYRILRTDIERAGRTAWVTEELAVFEDLEHYRAPPEDRALRLKGSKKLDGLGLAVLARLVQWRDQWAQSRNRPIRALIRDDVLVEIARRRPRQESDLEVLRGFPQARNPKIIQELLTLIVEAEQTPPSSWPQPYERREDSPLGAAVLDLLSGVTQAVCDEQRVARMLVGGAQRLRELLDYESGRSEQKPALLQGWRSEFIGIRLAELLHGRSEIHLSGWPERPRIEVRAHASRKKPS